MFDQEDRKLASQTAQDVREWIQVEYLRAESLSRKVELQDMHVELCRHLESQAATFEELRDLTALRQFGYHSLLVSEATALGGRVQRMTLADITAREVRTGRMAEHDEFHVRANAGLSVLRLAVPASSTELERKLARWLVKRPLS